MDLNESMIRQRIRVNKAEVVPDAFSDVREAWDRVSFVGRQCTICQDDGPMQRNKNNEEQMGVGMDGTIDIETIIGGAMRNTCCRAKSLLLGQFVVTE